MRIADQWQDFEILDTSSGEKLERWGNTILIRPDPQVIWKPEKGPEWQRADARYNRSSAGGGSWQIYRSHPQFWTIGYRDLKFKISPTGFKHTGLFPEQAVNWDFFREKIEKAGRPIRVLNLFAYTGGATLACAAAGAAVCHVDASKGMVAWARENQQLSGLVEKPIRWIVDDCQKFVEREIRRGSLYDGVIMDPPSYGRGPGGEVWKLEDSVYDLVKLCHQFLYHRAEPQRNGIYFEHHRQPPLCRKGRNLLFRDWAAGKSHRLPLALRLHRRMAQQGLILRKSEETHFEKADRNRTYLL